VGIAEFDLATGDQKVIVMITEADREYHIIFNRAIGINADTGSGSFAKVRDTVLITSRDNHDEPASEAYFDPFSFLEDELSQGEFATIPNYNDSGESL
jgi:hypothetical protein